MIYKNCADCDAIFGSKTSRKQCCNICLAIRARRARDSAISQLRAPRSEIEKAKKKTSRKCITCEKKFPSEGKHNRMCGDCRGKS